MPQEGFHLTFVYTRKRGVLEVVELSLHELLYMVYHRRFAYSKNHSIDPTVHSNA
jgi:hypothetical protein